MSARTRVDVLEDSDVLLLIEKIYDAALDPGEWQSCIELAARTFGNGASGFYIFDMERQVMDTLIAAGIEPDFQDSLMRHFGPLNPYPDGIHNNIALGTAITDAHIARREDVRKTEFYNDWIRPQGLDVYQFGAKLAKGPTRYAAFVAQPDPGQFEKHEARYFELMRLLIPHLSKALRFNRALEGLNNTNASLAGAFDRADVAVLILDQHKMVTLANAAGERLLTNSDVVTANSLSGVAAADKSCLQSFAAALDGCLAHHGPRSVGPVILKARGDGARHVAWVQAIGHRLTPAHNETIRTFGLFGAEPTLAVFITSMQRDRPLKPEMCANMFGLTPAESQLTTALCHGESIAQYALRMGVSRNTVRAQLASVFDKTGTNRQAELVALVWRSTSVLGSL